MDGIDLEKRVKESLNKKAIESTARETEKQPSGKAAKEANDDKEEAKAAEPVAKEEKKTPRKESTGRSCPNCYDDDVVLESTKK